MARLSRFVRLRACSYVTVVVVAVFAVVVFVRMDMGWWV